MQYLKTRLPLLLKSFNIKEMILDVLPIAIFEIYVAVGVEAVPTKILPHVKWSIALVEPKITIF